MGRVVDVNTQSRYSRGQSGRVIGSNRNGIIRQKTGLIALEIPQDIALVESVAGEVTVSWTDVSQSVDGYKIYRRLTSLGGSWGVALGSVSEAIETYTDTTIFSNTQYDYKVVAYIGTNETTQSLIGENQSSITTIEIVTGLLFADGDYLAYPSTKTFSGEFHLKFGIQGLTDPSGSIGLAGAHGGSSDRILMSFSLNKVRANIGSGTLLQSPLLSPSMDLSGRRIIEIYRDGSDDLYLIDGDNPTQFLFNAPNDFDVFSIYVTGGFGTAGYLYYYHDGDNEFLINEGSGLIVSSEDETVDLDIVTTGDLTYVNDTMWTAIIPPPTGFIEFTSLSASGRPTDILKDLINANPADKH